ncbi:MAG TPA: MarR family transcriptional regulator [Balneolales bacterium]|nr:MarR family transcriptional regulator [Balneolales bacterium]
MANALYDRVKQKAYDSSRQEAMINLLVAAGHYRQLLNELCGSYGITHDQYNIMRILHGVYPEGYPRCEIIDRMIERTPDVTRLVDRLVKRGYVERVKSETDKRLSVAKITQEGSDLLDEMDPKLKKMVKEFSKHVPKKEMKKLSGICSRLYEPYINEKNSTSE